MKIFLLGLAFLVCFAMETNAQIKKPGTKTPVKKTTQQTTVEAPKIDDVSKPSKEETIKWLHEKFQKYTITDEYDFEKKENCTAGHVLNFITSDYLNRISIPSKKNSDFPPVSIENDELLFSLNEWAINIISGSTYKSSNVFIPVCDINNVTVYSWGGFKFLSVLTNSSTINFSLYGKHPIERKGWGDDVTYHVDFSKDEVKTRLYMGDNIIDDHEYRQVAFIPFDADREPDLVKRINDAIQHLKTFCEAKPKEAF